jgi:predicted Co/Zn/Cd cation transporter (cation efflux family)
MIELTVHESFPLKDDNKYIDVVASVARQWGSNLVSLSPETFDTPSVFEFVFYCVNKCENPHVVASDGHRWIMSALVAAGVLPGCGWKQVSGFIDTFHIDEKDPRVVVRIG